MTQPKKRRGKKRWEAWLLRKENGEYYGRIYNNKLKAFADSAVLEEDYKVVPVIVEVLA